MMRQKISFLLKKRLSTVIRRGSPYLTILLSLHALGTSCLGQTSGQISLLSPLRVSWRFESNELLNLALKTQSESIYLPLASGQLLSIGVNNGGLLWRTEVGGQIASSPLVDEKTVYLASTPDSHFTNAAHSSNPIGELRAMSAQSGITLWRSTFQSHFIGELVSNNSSIFGCLEDGAVISISKNEGRVLWMHRAASPCQAGLAINGDLLFVSFTDGSVDSLSQHNGELKWRYQTSSFVSALAATDRYLFLGSRAKTLYAFSSEGQLLWRKSMRGSIQFVVPSLEGLLVTTLDNSAYFLSSSTGKRFWKKSLNGRTAFPPLVSSGAILFSTISGDEYEVLDLKSGKKRNSIFVGEENKVSAPPAISGQTLLLPTRKGLLSFVEAR